MTPAVVPYVVSSGLANVELSESLEKLEEAEKVRLTEDFLLITDSRVLDFYQAYLVNSSPFVTTDSVLHSYLTLLNDSLVASRRVRYGPQLQLLLEDAAESLKPQYETHAKQALEHLQIFLAKIQPPENEQFDFEDKLGLNPTEHHYLMMEELQKRVFSCRSDSELKTCLMVCWSLSTSSNFEVLNDYVALTNSLVGAAEDPGVADFLQAMEVLELPIEPRAIAALGGANARRFGLSWVEC